MVVRELITRWVLNADNKKVEQFGEGIKKAKKETKGLLARVKDLRKGLFNVAKEVTKVTLGIGALVAPIALAVKQTAALGDRVAKTSRAIGVGTGFLQEMEFAAERTGLAVRDFDSLLLKFPRRIGEAVKGVGESKDVFKELGVALVDAQGKTRGTEEVFLETLDALSKMSSEADQARVAQKLFEEQGVKLLNVAKLGAEGIDQLRREARRLGGVMDEQATKAAERFTDEMTNLRLALRGTVIQLGSAILPAVTRFIRDLREQVIRNRDLILQRLRRFADFVGKVLRATIQVLAAGGRIVGFLVDRLGDLVDRAKEVRGGMLALQVVLVTIFALFSPITAAIAGLLLVLDDLIVFFQGGRSVTGFLVAKIPQLWKRATQAVTDFFDDVDRRTGGLLSRISEILSVAKAITGGNPLGLATSVGKLLTGFGFIGGGETPAGAAAAGGAPGSVPLQINNNAQVTIGGTPAPGVTPTDIEAAVDRAMKKNNQDLVRNLGIGG